MPAFNPRIFTNPDRLKHISPARLKTFLGQWQDYFEARGLDIASASTDDMPLDDIAHILMNPDASVPEDMVDALYYVHPKGRALRTLAIGTRVQALAAADDFLRETETTSASAKSRRWLNDPATMRQIELLHRAGHPADGLDFGLSKYAANCHLNFRWNRSAIRAAVLRDTVRSAA